MNYRISLLALLLVTASVAEFNWVIDDRSNIETGATLVPIIDANDGLVVALWNVGAGPYDTYISVSTDDGSTFGAKSLVVSGTSGVSRTLQVVDSSTFFFVNGADVYKSDDAGDNVAISGAHGLALTNVLVATSNGAGDIAFGIDPSTGASKLSISSDGGENFTVRDIGTFTNGNAIGLAYLGGSGDSATIVCLCTTANVAQVTKTTDGGQNWSTLTGTATFNAGTKLDNIVKISNTEFGYWYFASGNVTKFRHYTGGGTAYTDLESGLQGALATGDGNFPYAYVKGVGGELTIEAFDETDGTLTTYLFDDEGEAATINSAGDIIGLLYEVDQIDGLDVTSALNVPAVTPTTPSGLGYRVLGPSSIEFEWFVSSNDPNRDTGEFTYQVFANGIALAADTIDGLDGGGSRQQEFSIGGGAEIPFYVKATNNTNGLTSAASCIVIVPSGETGRTGSCGTSPLGNPSGGGLFNVAEAAEATGFSVDAMGWLMGLILIFGLAGGVYGATGGQLFGAGLGALLGVGASVAFGFIPIWFVVFLVVIATAIIVLWRR